MRGGNGSAQNWLHDGTRNGMSPLTWYTAPDRNRHTIPPEGKTPTSQRQGMAVCKRRGWRGLRQRRRNAQSRRQTARLGSGRRQKREVYVAAAEEPCSPSRERSQGRPAPRPAAAARQPAQGYGPHGQDNATVRVQAEGGTLPSHEYKRKAQVVHGQSRAGCSMSSRCVVW